MSMASKAREFLRALTHLDGRAGFVFALAWSLLYLALFACAFFARLVPFMPSISFGLVLLYLAAWAAVTWLLRPVPMKRGRRAGRVIYSTLIVATCFAFVLLRVQFEWTASSIYLVGFCAIWVACALHNAPRGETGPKAWLALGGRVVLAFAVSGFAVALLFGWTFEVAEWRIWRTEVAFLTPRFQEVIRRSLERRTSSDYVARYELFARGKVLAIDEAARALDPVVSSYIPRALRPSHPDEVGTVLIVRWNYDTRSGDRLHECLIKVRQLSEADRRVPVAEKQWRGEFLEDVRNDVATWVRRLPRK
jgi:hypothetical protein